jgi:CDP-diacylglycerol--glycerol-3-phosphate 3-phosphatidyltransferase
MAGATAVAIGSGRLFLGLVLLGLAAIPDLLDGAVAKASGTSSQRGAFFDSVADRVTDALVLGGIAWHFALSRGGLAPMLPFAVLGASTLISYERAKAESLGFDAKGGLMERAERLIALGVALLFESLMVPIQWVILVLTVATAGQRFAKVWSQASPDRPVAAKQTHRLRTRALRPARANLRRADRGSRTAERRAAWQRRMREHRSR